MKIFNWIHRHRFPYNVHPAEASLPEDGSSGIRSKTSVQGAKIEREPLLEEDVKPGDWELDGILTIGTLAIDPLTTITGLDDDDEEEDDYHDEAVAGAKLLNEIFSSKMNDEEKKCCNEIEEVEEVEMMKYEKLNSLETRMARVTLLDLFIADDLAQRKLQSPEGGVQDEEAAMEIDKMKKRPILYTKLAAGVGGRKGSKPKKTDAPPLKKLQRFMTRMMKKKIHPDMEGKLQKKGQVKKLNDDVPVLSSKNNYFTESVYLLPVQGITA